MQTVLAIDTSTAACSAALWRDGAVRARRYEVLGRGHAENLLAMIDDVNSDAGVVPDALTLIAVTTGPGAFTGIRLGLATARGLALALGIPCAGFTTTETMAAAVRAGPGEAVVAVLDSKRGDFYVQVFDGSGQALSEAAVASADGLADAVARAVPAGAGCVLAGDVQKEAARIIEAAGLKVRTSEILTPDAGVLAGLAAGRGQAGAALARPAPLYLRPADATPAKRGGRIRE
jgi:tRNA threonylcarbamoyladenosine biosynthesis protein TsaB